MSREKLAAAYDALAEAHKSVADATAQVAHELRANEPAPVAVPESGGASAAPPQRSPAPAVNSPAQGFPDQDKCPSHGREWKDGNYGPFCTAKSDDPAWSNKNGYCTINPKNAPKWLEIHQPSVEYDVDSVPF